MKNATTLGAGLLIFSLAGAARAQHAREPAPDKAAAGDFFDAGAQAYRAGQYLVAAEAFLRANEIAPSPALLFSAAQAYRRQFLAEPAGPTLRRAIGLYRDYLRTDKAPKRREDAMQALAALTPFEARYLAAPGGDGEAEPPRDTSTRLLLSTSAEVAEISVDDGPFLVAPATVKVKPGPHQVRIRAAGYTDEQIAVQAIDHELVPRHVTLHPVPAHLSVTGTSGAAVSIDGTLRAKLPLRSPLPVDPGAHFVTVTMTGHKPVGVVVDLARNGSAHVAADLDPTRQRIAAWATIAAGGAGAVATGVLGALALKRQGQAASIADAREAAPIDVAQRDQYNAALKARDNLARAALITGGVSAVTLIAGFGLFAVDRPEIAPPDDLRLRAPRPGPKVDLEVGILSVGVKGVF